MKCRDSNISDLIIKNFSSKNNILLQITKHESDNTNCSSIFYFEQFVFAAGNFNFVDQSISEKERYLKQFPGGDVCRLGNQFGAGAFFVVFSGSGF